MDGGGVVFLMPCCYHVQFWVEGSLLTSAVAFVVARADFGRFGGSRFLIGREARKGGGKWDKAGFLLEDRQVFIGQSRFLIGEEAGQSHVVIGQKHCEKL